MDHIGIVAGPVTDRVACIEGNTSDGGSQSNGGQVLVKSRPVNLIPAVIQLPSTLMGQAQPAPQVDLGSDEFRRFVAAMLVPHVGALPVLKRGHRGLHVEYLQHALNVGGAGLTVDGVFGPGTDAAVVAFQRRAGVAADGVVGPVTRWWLATSMRKVAGL